MEYSAIVLVGGLSTRLGQDKALLSLGNKPMVLHVLDTVSSVVNEQIVAASNQDQKKHLQNIVKHRAEVVVDEHKTQTPLSGAHTGFSHAKNEYAILLSCDTPFVNKEIARLLLDTCVQKTASIPRWPEGYIEPLQAAYHTKTALAAAKKALEDGELNMRAMIAKMRNVRYISTLVLQQLDPKLYTFFNINAQADLKQAEGILKRINSGSTTQSGRFQKW